jgi:hypothetical protein
MVRLALCALLPTLAAAAEPQVVWVLDVRGLPLAEKVAALATQGLLNRAGPRVFLRFGRDCRWMDLGLALGKPECGSHWDPAAAEALRAKWGAEASVEDHWVEHFTATGRYRFVKTDLATPLARAAVVKGWVLYDNVREDCCPLATLAGLEDAVPVTAALRDKLAAAGVKLPVVRDWREVRAGFAPGADRRLEAHRWAISNLLPRCARDGAVSRDRTYGLDAHDTLVDIDQAVQRRWFVYDLDHSAAANSGQRADPPDLPLLSAILGALAPWSPVFGWGRPNEEESARSIGRAGQTLVCSGVVNNSFFAALPSTTKAWRQRRPHLTPEQVTVEDKVYVALLVNEGDTVKSAISLGCFGSWIQPERGTVPINWGLDPLLCRTHPGLMDYYYQTMTDRDYFFAAPAGWGYLHPGWLTPEQVATYTAQARAGAALADLRYLDVWWPGKVDLHAFGQAAGMAGVTQWHGEQAVRFSPAGVPVVRSNHYYTLDKGPEAFAQRLREDLGTVEPPWFVVVYGAKEHGTPHRFAQVAKRLPPERFKVVALDELCAAAVKSRARIEGRVWRPGPGQPKGTRP